VYKTQNYAMRTNIDLDDRLLEQGFAITGLRTKKELVNFALAELIKRNTKKDLLELAGEIEFVPGFSTDTVRNNRYVIEVLRDKTKVKAASLKTAIAGRSYYLPIFSKMELLQGCKDEIEWTKISSYLSVQNYYEPNYDSIWENTARLYFELRRQGITIRSNIDCAIAIIAIENNLILYHFDRDFETIAQHTVLKEKKVDLSISA
jgi:predicted nucleic acid-binding protein/Arc/MetJ family transcription regulator